MAALKDREPYIYEKTQDAFIRELMSFHHSRGSQFNRQPCVAGRPIDLYCLYTSVLQLGGYLKVVEEDRWDELLGFFNIPKYCTNAAPGLKFIYCRYLEAYEKVHNPDLAPVKTYEEEEVAITPPNKRQKTQINTVPMNYNYNQHRVSDNLRERYGLSMDLIEPNQYARIEKSLLSGLPNELDVAFNICLLLSNEGKHSIRLHSATNLVPLLLGHIGLFSLGNKSFLDMYEKAWKQNSQFNYDKFWKDSVTSREVLALIQPCETVDEILMDSMPDNDTEEVEKSLFNLKNDLGEKNVACQHVLHVSTIIRNLSFDPDNAQQLADDDLVFRFLMLCLHNRMTNLPQLALDTLGNISNKMLLGEPHSKKSQLMLQIATEAICSVDRFQIVSGLEILAGLCQVYANETLITEFLQLQVYHDIIRFLTVHDIQLIIYTLDCIFQLTELGKVPVDIILSIHKSIELLVNLLTIEAQSFGPASLMGIKVVEHYPLPAALPHAGHHPHPQLLPPINLAHYPHQSSSSKLQMRPSTPAQRQVMPRPPQSPSYSGCIPTSVHHQKIAPSPSSQICSPIMRAQAPQQLITDSVGIPIQMKGERVQVMSVPNHERHSPLGTIAMPLNIPMPPLSPGPSGSPPSSPAGLCSKPQGQTLVWSSTQAGQHMIFPNSQAPQFFQQGATFQSGQVFFPNSSQVLACSQKNLYPQVSVSQSIVQTTVGSHQAPFVLNPAQVQCSPVLQGISVTNDGVQNISLPVNSGSPVVFQCHFVAANNLQHQKPSLGQSHPATSSAFAVVSAAVPSQFAGKVCLSTHSALNNTSIPTNEEKMINAPVISTAIANNIQEKIGATPSRGPINVTGSTEISRNVEVKIIDSAASSNIVDEMADFTETLGNVYVKVDGSAAAPSNVSSKVDGSAAAPSNVQGSAFSCDNAANSVAAPSDVDSKTANSVAAPSNVDGKAADSSVTPSNVDGKAADSSVTPSNVDGKTVDSSVTPSNVDGKAVDSSVTPSNVDSMLKADSTAIPSIVNSNVSDSVAIASNIDLEVASSGIDGNNVNIPELAQKNSCPIANSAETPLTLNSAILADRCTINSPETANPALSQTCPTNSTSGLDKPNEAAMETCNHLSEDMTCVSNSSATKISVCDGTAVLKCNVSNNSQLKNLSRVISSCGKMSDVVTHPSCVPSTVLNGPSSIPCIQSASKGLCYAVNIPISIASLPGSPSLKSSGLMTNGISGMQPGKPILKPLNLEEYSNSSEGSRFSQDSVTSKDSTSESSSQSDCGQKTPPQIASAWLKQAFHAAGPECKISQLSVYSQYITEMSKSVPPRATVDSHTLEFCLRSVFPGLMIHKRVLENRCPSEVTYQGLRRSVDLPCNSKKKLNSMHFVKSQPIGELGTKFSNGSVIEGSQTLLRQQLLGTNGIVKVDHPLNNGCSENPQSPMLNGDISSDASQHSPALEAALNHPIEKQNGTVVNGVCIDSLQMSDSPLSEDSALPSPCSSDRRILSRPSSVDSLQSESIEQPIVVSDDFLCEWAGCLLGFKTVEECATHVLRVHYQEAQKIGFCRWQGCDSVYRQPWSVVTHIQDRHTNQAALTASLEARHKRLPPPIISSNFPRDAAFQAVRRFAAKPPYTQLMDPKEGPVTKHIRLTAALILRNLVRNSKEGQMSMMPFESRLAMIAFSTSEAAGVVSTCLFELQKFPKTTSTSTLQTEKEPPCHS